MLVDPLARVAVRRLFFAYCAPKGETPVSLVVSEASLLSKLSVGMRAEAELGLGPEISACKAW